MGSRSTSSRRSAWGPITAAVLAVTVLAGCSGEGIPRPTVTGSVDGSALPSVTASLPDVTRSPRPSDSPTTEAPEPTTEAPRPTETVAGPTETVTATPDPEPVPTETVTETPTPTPTETVTATPTPTPTVTAEAAPAPVEAEDTGSPWLWWVLGAGLAGLVAFLVLRSRRRAAWNAQLAEAEAEADWFARTLLPQLQQAESPDALAGGWHVGGSERVVAVEDRLTGLETSAPDQPAATRASEVRDAVRAARLGVEGLIVSGDPTASARVLGSLAASLAAVLDPPAPPAPPAPHA